jgi:Cys-tRNA(Pro)/Cys-tRNA(Cys) deacylase
MKAGTQAILAAQRAGVPFSVHEYRHDPGAAYGIEAAEKLGLVL